MDMSIDFFDFGINPDIPLPTEAEVFDATPLARAGLGLLDGASEKHLIDPAAGPPLTAAKFKDRANSICRAVSVDAEALLREQSGLIEALKQSAKTNPEKALGAFREVGVKLYEPLFDLYQRILRQLGQLRPPAETASLFRTFLDRGAGEVELIGAQTSALEVGELRLYQRLNQELETRSDASDRIAEKLGLDDCSGNDGSAGAIPA